MRTRTSSTTARTTIAAAVAALAVATSACTSEDPGPPSPAPTGDADAAATSSADGLKGTEGSNGWFCDTFSPSAVDAAAGGKAVSPRQVEVENDQDSWVCEVTSGGKGEQETVLRISLRIGEEARAEARARAEAADEVQPGPEHLGRSYISPGLVTGLTACSDPNAADSAAKVPFTLVAESLKVSDAEVTEKLRAALSLAAQNYDRSVGCSPKQAIKDLSDDAAATSAP